MSIFGGFGKLFGFSGDEAEAFGSSLVGEGASTFSDNIDKSIDKFDRQVEEYGKITLASDLEDAKVNKKSLNDKVNGISTFARLGFSPAYAAAIYSAPAATQKIMIDAANATEDKSTLDSLWETSVEINKEMPALGITDAAKLLIGNQITPERDYSGIPETKNMLTRLGFNANLRDAVKNRVESRPDIKVDLSTDVDATIPTGGPSKDAMTRAKALNAKDKTASKETYANATVGLIRLEAIGKTIDSTIPEIIAGLKAGNELERIVLVQIEGKGGVVGQSMYMTNRNDQLYSIELKSPTNSKGVVLFDDKVFMKKMKALNKLTDGVTSNNYEQATPEKQLAFKQMTTIINQIKTQYGIKSGIDFAKLL